MPRATQFRAFSGKGYRLGSAPNVSAPSSNAYKFVSGGKHMIVKGAKTKTTSFAARSRRTHSNGLKPTTMSRIVSSAVYETACDDMRQGGIDWYKKSRCTRSTCPPDVTRKAKNAVTAISAEAEELLGNVFGSATFAMDHAKRKTLKKSDMDLVSKIARNTGPFHAFFG